MSKVDFISRGTKTTEWKGPKISTFYNFWGVNLTLFPPPFQTWNCSEKKMIKG